MYIVLHELVAHSSGSPYILTLRGGPRLSYTTEVLPRILILIFSQSWDLRYGVEDGRAGRGRRHRQHVGWVRHQEGTEID